MISIITLSITISVSFGTFVPSAFIVTFLPSSSTKSCKNCDVYHFQVVFKQFKAKFNITFKVRCCTIKLLPCMWLVENKFRNATPDELFNVSAIYRVLTSQFSTPSLSTNYSNRINHKTYMKQQMHQY